MVTLKMSDFIKTGADSSAEDFVLFRHIEDWCYANIPSTKWKFSWGTTEQVHGVDVPAFISFTHILDATAFNITFKKA